MYTSDILFQLVLSSDKLATIREPLVSVQFYTQNSEGGCHLDLELNKEELKHLIVALEAANKVGPLSLCIYIYLYLSLSFSLCVCV